MASIRKTKTTKTTKRYGNSRTNNQNAKGQNRCPSCGRPMR